MSEYNFSKAEIIKGDIFPLKIEAGSNKIIIRLSDKVRRVRLVGLIFDDKKCFLLPKSLPGIKTIIDMHKKNEKAEILIVGHASAAEESSNADIALNRAEMLGAYLTNKPNTWLPWFAPDKEARSRWGVREIQLMLSVLPEGGESFYSGSCAGISDEKTIEAIKKFQAHCNTTKGKNITVNGKAGPATRIELVQAYMNLSNTTLTKGIKVVAHGCEGHSDDSLTESGLQPDDRRIEVFFFDQVIDPAPGATTSTSDKDWYSRWKGKVKENDDFENHGVYVQIVDAKKQPAPLATVYLSGPTQGEAKTDEFGFVEFYDLKLGEYTLHTEKDGMSIGQSKFAYPIAATVQGFGKK
jgi:hypothetical protein